MSHLLRYQSTGSIVEIELPLSKSEANRLLIAQALSKVPFEIERLSDAEDTAILKAALASNDRDINVGMAGTAFRFLTAFFSYVSGERVLTGAERMKKRPIRVLVDQLRLLGAQIDYLEEEGYPPLKITGGGLSGGSLKMDGTISSQYVTALLLIAPMLKGGLSIELEGELVSVPYIDLTLSLQQQLGIQVQRSGNRIYAEEGGYTYSTAMHVGSDWSSAAFFYQITALGKQELLLMNLSENSLQGDQVCAELFKKLGVQTHFNKRGVLLKPIEIEQTEELELDMTDCPDLIPSVAVTASQFIRKTIIRGTQTLYLKESNRVEALQNELKKVGVKVVPINTSTMEVYQATKEPQENIATEFKSYNDHRMAMSFAPLATLLGQLRIDEPSVVEKSFPNYWKELEKVGITS